MPYSYYELTVSTSGDGSGSAGKNPSGVKCGAANNCSSMSTACRYHLRLWQTAVLILQAGPGHVPGQEVVLS